MRVKGWPAKKGKLDGGDSEFREVVAAVRRAGYRGWVGIDDLRTLAGDGG